MSDYETKDSGERAQYDSGMVRDSEEGKARFDLIFPLGVPYSEQMMTRFAELMARGAIKYDARNWELAKGEEELARYRSSALRHLIQWATGETDEDHAAAVMFNVMAGETVRFKMKKGGDHRGTRITNGAPCGGGCHVWSVDEDGWVPAKEMC